MKLFKKVSKYYTLNDAHFEDNLKFKKATKNDDAHWQVECKILEIDDIITFNIYNNNSGISSAQKELVLSILERYCNLIHIFEKYINTKLKGTSISIKDDFNILYIDISSKQDKSKKWTICYQENKGFTLYELDIENWQPISLGISA